MDELYPSQVPVSSHAAIREAKLQDSAPPDIPDHRLLRCVGRGSYGSVWLARNILGVYRAVKIVERKSFKDQKPFERELSGIRRFEPISRSHEGFIDVLQVGIDEAHGFFYYVMELGDDQVTGQDIRVENYSPKTLAKEVSANRALPWEDCLKLGLALSLALAELHKHGLVHRDVKPSNIIFVNGIAKLADIGLVADVGEACSYVGTEGFIPPEGPGKPQADVYGLGKVLYEVSTGRDRQDFPELPTQWGSSPANEQWAELNEIILRACNAEPQKRYQSAWEMHADLLVLANGQSVRRLKTLERRMHNAKRLGIAALLVVATALALGFPVYRGHKVLAEAHQQQVGANIAYGTRSLEAGDLFGSLPYFVSALQLDGENSAKRPEHRLRIGSILAQCPKLVRIWSNPREIDQVLFSPDGKRVFTAEVQGQARILDITSGRPVTPPFAHAAFSPRASFSPDGATIAYVADDPTLHIYSAFDGRELAAINQPTTGWGVCFSPDGREIAVGCDDGVHIWATNGVARLTIPGITSGVWSVTYSPDGRLLATSSRDGAVRIWDAETGKLSGLPLKHPSVVRVLSFSPDSKLLATGCADRYVRVWEVETGWHIAPDMEHHDELRAVQFSPDGNFIMSACLDHTVCLWRTRDHQPLTPYPVLRHSDRVTHAALAPDGHRIVSCCIDGTVRIWDLAGTSISPIPAHHPVSADGSRFVAVENDIVKVCETISSHAVGPNIRLGERSQEIRLSANGGFVFAWTTNRADSSTLTVWSALTGNQVGPPIELKYHPGTVLVTTNGVRLAVTGNGHTSVWRLGPGEPITNNSLASTELDDIALSPDGDYLAGWRNNRAQIWELATGRQVFQPHLEYPVPIRHLEFSPDGGRFVVCGADDGFTKCAALVYLTKTGELIGAPMPHGDGIVWATFSHDGARVATSGEDFNAFIWDAATGRQLAAGMHHNTQIWSIEFSANDKWVTTSSPDRTARLWDAQTGEPLAPPFTHLIGLRDSRFIQNDTALVTRDWFGGIVVWPLTIEEMSIPDLLSLTHLLCGDSVSRATLEFTDHESPPELWQRLRTQYPSKFTTSREQVVAWHEFQARQNERQSNWRAALFHVEQLQKLAPNDAELSHRMGELEAKLKAN